MKLEYETVANGGTPLYNGNIINQEWSVYNGACGTRQLYRYYYDAANRLTTANHEHVGDFLSEAKMRAFFVSFHVFEGA